MGKELDKCRMERDRYKVFVEQLRNRNYGLKSEGFSVNIFTQSHNNIISGHELLAKTKEQNNILKIEVKLWYSHYMFDLIDSLGRLLPIKL